MTYLHTVAATTKTGSKFSLRRTNAEICKLAHADIKAALPGTRVCLTEHDGHVISLSVCSVPDGTDPAVALVVATSTLLEYRRESNVSAFTNFYVKALYTGAMAA